MTAKRSPILGYNHNVKYRGLVFHVQTEDSGMLNPHLFTHLFHEGVIVSTRKLVYDAGANEDSVKSLMQAQHKAVMKDLMKGTFDDKIDLYLGGTPGLEPSKNAPLAEAAPVAAGERAKTDVDGDAAVDAGPAQPRLEIVDEDLSEPIVLPVKARVASREHPGPAAIPAVGVVPGPAVGVVPGPAVGAVPAPAPAAVAAVPAPAPAAVAAVPAPGAAVAAPGRTAVVAAAPVAPPTAPRPAAAPELPVVSRTGTAPRVSRSSIRATPVPASATVAARVAAAAPLAGASSSTDDDLTSRSRQPHDTLVDGEPAGAVPPPVAPPAPLAPPPGDLAGRAGQYAVSRRSGEAAPAAPPLEGRAPTRDPSSSSTRPSGRAPSMTAPLVSRAPSRNARAGGVVVSRPAVVVGKPGPVAPSGSPPPGRPRSPSGSPSPGRPRSPSGAASLAAPPRARDPRADSAHDARPQPEKSLDEVIMAYLSEDPDGT